MRNTLSKGGIAKRFCLVLILCIAAQTLCIMPNAAAESITVIESFDNGTDSNITNGGLKYTSPNGALNGWGNSTFSYVDRNGGKALMMNKAAGACGYPGVRLNINLNNGFGFNSTNMLGRMEYSFDIFSNGTNTTALVIPDMSFVLEDIKDGNKRYQIAVISPKTGQFVTNGNKTKVGTFNRGQWNTVRIALDYMNNMIEYYINDIEYDFEFDFSVLKGALLKADISASCSDANNGIDYGLDNFKAEFIPNETAEETLKAENLVIEDSDGYEVNISEFDGESVNVSFNVINSYSDTKYIRIILAAYKNSDELTFVRTDTESLLPLSSKTVKKTFDYPKGVECTKLCAYVWNASNMNPLCSFVKAADSTSTKYVLLTDVTESFDGKERNYPILLSEDYPLIKLGDLAELIGGTSTADSLTKDGETVRFEPKNRLGEYNGGHLMLEREPIMRYGELYVSISVVQTALCYSMEYYRFDNRLELSSGTNYPDTEYIVYAHDFGAVGDGVTDDKDAILKAFNAAIMSNRPSKLVLDANKTYLVSEKVDTWAFFDLNGVENFIFDGNGSKILFETPTNTFVGMSNCTNVQFMNIDAQWKEHTSTQGAITSIDYDKKRFVLKIDSGYSLPPTDEWVTEFQGSTGAWSWAQIMEPANVADRLKIMSRDHYVIESVKEVGDRLYMIQLNTSSSRGLESLNTGDRFTIKTKQFAYDFSSTGKSGSTNAINILRSKDVTFDGVYVYGGHMFMCGAGFCDGRLVFKNSGMKLKNGQLEVTNADGIHIWRNRANLIVDNCTFLNSLDDHINTKSENAVVVSSADNKTFTVDYYLNWRIGDEMLVYDKTNHSVLGTAYLKNVEQSGSNYILTLDREIVGAKTDGTTLVYDVDASSRGTVIKNSTFKNSRRHAYIGRSPNTLVMNNTVENCGASAVAAMNELVDNSRCEGPFPSTFTMRDNTVTGVGTTPGFYPIEVKSWGAKNGETKAIDGLLIENNSVSQKNTDSFIVINSVKDLYMINNEVKYNGELLSTTKPIVISNSDIALIDGVNFDFTQNVNAVITIDGCNVDENNIKNINVNSGNTAKKYVIK